MGKYTSWDDFYRDAVVLQSLSPDETRFVTKYRHVDGKLDLRVTNDRTHLVYTTDQFQDLKRFDHLSRDFISQAQTGRVPEPVAVTVIATPTAEPSVLAAHIEATPIVVDKPAVSEGGSTGGGGKKKKKKGKK